MIKKVELLAPAGNLEKAKIALLYGADAVYVGGKQLSLRARASNFELSDLAELATFAHVLGKKVYVTTNIIPHDEDMIDIDEYLKALAHIKIDAIIASSYAIFKRAQIVAPLLECHLSTQMSSLNYFSLGYWQEKGVTRVVLAREVTIDEMKQIADQTPVELEVFIHGGMCSSFSGRCVLSNHMTNRDANRGGCAHSCRWNYTLYYQKKPLPGIFNFGSKDLMALDYLEDLLKMNIASLKIEGRMKSAYYLATVVRTYRMLIDAFYEKQKIDVDDLEKAKTEILKAENRLTSSGFYQGIPDVSGQLYDNRSEQPTKEYIGYCLGYDEINKQALIEQRNYFKVGDEVEFFGPRLDNINWKITKIYDALSKESIDVARHPLQKVLIDVPFKLSEHDMMRLRLK